jgi:hypothetical protein
MFILGDIIELELDSDNCFWSYGDKSMLNNDLVIKGKLGSGGYGSVYDLEDENLVIKIIKDSGYSEHLEQLKEYIKEENLGEVLPDQVRNYFLNDVKREVEYQNLAYTKIKDIDGNPITPKVIAACVCNSKKEMANKIGIIIMEKIEGTTMTNLLSRNKNKSVNNLISIREQIINIIDQLKNLNFVHGDMLRDNIVIKNINTRPVVHIIDWGQATTVELYPYYFAKRHRKTVKLEDPTWKDIKLLDKIIEKKEMKNNAIEKLNKMLEKRKSSLDNGGYKKKSYSRKKCPRGSISRRGYTYLKKSTGKRIRVKSGCIKSKGLRRSAKKSKKSKRRSVKKSKRRSAKKSKRRSAKKSKRRSAKKSKRRSAKKSKRRSAKKSKRRSTKKSKRRSIKKVKRSRK